MKRTEFMLATKPVPRKRVKYEISEDQKLEIKEVFDMFDTQKHGFLSGHELKVALRALGFEVKKPEVIQILREYDPTKSGKIEYSDFLELLTIKISERDPREEMLKAYKLFSDEATGSITLRTLRRISREIGENLSEDELRAMIQEFDLDQDGQISPEEFLDIMRHTSVF